MMNVDAVHICWANAPELFFERTWNKYSDDPSFEILPPTWYMKKFRVTDVRTMSIYKGLTPYLLANKLLYLFCVSMCAFHNTHNQTVYYNYTTITVQGNFAFNSRAEHQYASGHGWPCELCRRPTSERIIVSALTRCGEDALCM